MSPAILPLGKQFFSGNKWNISDETKTVLNTDKQIYCERKAMQYDVWACR